MEKRNELKELKLKLEKERLNRRKQIMTRATIFLLVAGMGAAGVGKAISKGDKPASEPKINDKNIEDSIDLEKYYSPSESNYSVEEVEDEGLDLYGKHYDTKEEALEELRKNPVIIDEVTGENVLYIDENGNPYVTCPNNEKIKTR